MKFEVLLKEKRKRWVNSQQDPLLILDLFIGFRLKPLASFTLKKIKKRDNQEVSHTYMHNHPKLDLEIKSERDYQLEKTKWPTSDHPRSDQYTSGAGQSALSICVFLAPRAEPSLRFGRVRTCAVLPPPFSLPQLFIVIYSLSTVPVL